MKLVEYILRKAGRTYTLDSELPRTFLYGEMLRRGLDFVRGVITLRKPTFRGKNVQVRCKKNLALGSLASIGAGTIIDASGKRGVILGRGAKIGRRSIVTSSSSLGKRGIGLELGNSSGIGDYAHIGCSGGVFIGNDVIAGPFVTFHSQEHVIADLDQLIRSQGTQEAAIVVEDDVWIGARVTFLAGSRVGKGSVVAAGSVVRGEFAENSVIGGVPARVLRTRTGKSSE